MLCTKVSRYAERTYHPDRLLHPMRRVGKKGEGKFERISWDEAIDTIATRLSAIAAKNPQAILPYSYASAPWAWCRANRSRHVSSITWAPRCWTGPFAPRLTFTGYKYTIGATIGTDLEQFQNSKLIIIWGGNPIASNLHFWMRAQEAKRNGAKLIAIDPYRSLTAEKCHQHIALLPGTDAALALGLMHVLIKENLVDEDYIAQYTIGYGQLKERAAEWTPERVAATCGITVDEVVNLAREYGSMARRGEPVAIRTNYGVQRVRGGGMAVRNITCLLRWSGPGAIRAGGVQLSSSGSFPVNNAALQRPDLLKNGARTINMTTIGDDLLKLYLARVRTENRGRDRLQLESGGDRARFAQGHAGFRARGSVHGRARTFPDRYRRLCRHLAA
ncbi:molybdopterin-dependent oxidoreductase [Massilia sp. B-10]|nr:molybdopterin-dependent oxidoreductase [Massilia sp. B-10]